MMTATLTLKRLELIRELLPQNATVGFLGRTLTKTRLSQDFRAKRDSKLTCLTAWIASFVRAPYL